MYQLYGDRRSGSAAVEMALAEIGAPVALHNVSIDDDAQLQAEHRKLNPLGRVPVLVLPDGQVLTESVAILLTLHDRHPEAGLLPPPGDPGRANALRWMMVLAGEFYPAVTRNDYPGRFSTDPAHAPAIREAAIANGHAIWAIVEEQAAPAPFILGSRFSLADLYVATLSQWMQGRACPPAECPRIMALVREVAARPKAGPVWRKHFGTPP